MAGPKQNKVPFFSSLQVKYAMSYLVIFAVVLVLLNTYPVIASQELLVNSKRDSLKSQAAVMGSALMELETLSADQVSRVMTMLDSTGLDRILVTDPTGLILYDSTQEPQDEQTEEPKEEHYEYALLQEVVSALWGNDVFYSRYEDSKLISTAASPIMYRGVIIGAIYILEVDEAQGTLLVGFPQVKTMPVELYGVIMEYPLTAGPVLSLILIIPTVLILFLMRKYINADNLSQGYGMK